MARIASAPALLRAMRPLVAGLMSDGCPAGAQEAPGAAVVAAGGGVAAAAAAVAAGGGAPAATAMPGCACRIMLLFSNEVGDL